MCDACEAERDSEGLFSFRSVYEAALSCRKRKRNTLNALRFEVDLLANCLHLSEELRDGTYQPSRSLCFVVTAPKTREIFAADFRDRVVHHLVVPHLERIFEPKFIHDSYACRKNKGTHKAVERLQNFMRRVTHNRKCSAYFLQLDIHNFFMSIDKNILVPLIQKRVSSGALFSITKQIIEHDCTKHFIRRGDPALMAQLPPHKSLFHTEPEKGLPIGNLTSQFFANVTLNELDQFVKHRLKCKFYLRYMDDFILLHSSEAQLQEWKEKIAVFLKEKLGLRLKPQTILKRVNEGADFLGYIVRPHYRLVRNRVVGNLHWKLKAFNYSFQRSAWNARPDALRPVLDRLQNTGMSYRDGGDAERTASIPRRALERVNFFYSFGMTKKPLSFRQDGEILSLCHFSAESSQQFKLRQIMASYLGHFKYAQSHNLTEGLWKRFPFLNLLLRVDEANQLRPVNEPPYAPANLKAQYRWFQNKYKSHWIFFQMGSYVEFYEEQTVNALSLLGLKASQSRRGFSKECGFPMKQLSQFKRKSRQLNAAYVVIAENGYYRKGLKRRHMTELFYGGLSP